MDCILLPSEIDFYIESMSPQSIHNIGSPQWLDWHQRLQKLNQEALIEASQLKDEHVKESLVTFSKVSVLVHEALLISIWKQKVLPNLLHLEPNPPNTFLAYTILYHEAVAVALLENVMFHANCCDALGDTAADLLEYCCSAASQLLCPQQSNKETEELLKQKENLIFDVGIRVLSIIRYLAENLEILPLSVCSRMYDVYDVPILFVELLLLRPWVKNGDQFTAGKWMKWDGEALGQAEAQIWLTLRQLLLGPVCQNYYTITELRRSKLLKLMMLLTPIIMDQLAPLMELKQWLSHISISQQTAKSRPLLLETVLEVKEKIVAEAGGKWKQIARQQLPIVFSSDEKQLMEIAKKLSDAYNTDLIEKFEIKDQATCEQCDKNAIQRCSRCKKVWYCSRSCQVTHWDQHKELCKGD